MKSKYGSYKLHLQTKSVVVANRTGEFSQKSRSRNNRRKLYQYIRDQRVKLPLKIHEMLCTLKQATGR